MLERWVGLLLSERVGESGGSLKGCGMLDFDDFWNLEFRLYPFVVLCRCMLEIPREQRLGGGVLDASRWIPGVLFGSPSGKRLSVRSSESDDRSWPPGQDAFSRPIPMPPRRL